MRVSENSPAQQVVNSLLESAKTAQQIEVAILAKQQQVEKSTSDAVLKLLQSAVPTPNQREPKLDVSA